MRFIPLSVVLLGLAAPPALVANSVTFNRQIAPIIYRNCSSCHRPGEAAPFPLLSYADVVKKATMVAKVTKTHVMPPWKAEPASFTYRDERRLTEDEIALLRTWIENG